MPDFVEGFRYIYKTAGQTDFDSKTEWMISFGFGNHTVPWENYSQISNILLEKNECFRQLARKLGILRGYNFVEE